VTSSVFAREVRRLRLHLRWFGKKCAGALGSNNGSTGLPLFPGTTSLTYDIDDWFMTAQVRLPGAANRNSAGEGGNASPA
jgi:hypothetical protein